MTKLQILLVIRYKKLLDFPKTIGLHLNLHTLSLTRYYSLKKIHESVENLGGMSKHVVSHIKLIKLAESIRYLHNFKKLNISYSHIKRSPHGIDKLKILRLIACANVFV